METAPLKSFATWARTSLIREVTARITAVLAPGSTERVEQPAAVAALEKAVQVAGSGEKGRASVADTVAYTWFNRIIALRFMDANGYTGIGVVSPQAGVDLGQPEILAEAKRGVIDTEVVSQRTRTAVAGLLDGSRASSDPQGEAYGLLLADYCRHWNRAMPFMFQQEGDFTELLIPANLLSDDSVLNRAVKALTNDVCQDVEIIGWLYQFYISERKDEVFAGFKKGKKAGAEEIPAATQLFTPDWIVRYLVENSLGRLWMLNRPNSKLVDQMDYYVAPVEDESNFRIVSKPEELKVIDPACGSGHMLTYAFDLLYAIYEEEGYSPSEIPGLLLTNNLYGTEIDPRAGALAAFALSMKARAKQRTFFSKAVEPNICVIQNISFSPAEIDTLLSTGVDRHSELAFWSQFERADILGSLIAPDIAVLSRVSSSTALVEVGDDLLTSSLRDRVKRVIMQAEFLSPRYSVVVANPPYMGSANMAASLAEEVKDRLPLGKSDLFAAFILRSFGLLGRGGYSAMVVMQSWMFSSSYEAFREALLADRRIACLAHLGNGVMGIAFGTSAVVFDADSSADRLGAYLSYSSDDIVNGAPVVLPSKSKPTWRSSRSFSSIPGAPLVYAATDDEVSVLSRGPRVGDLATTREGLTTGANDLFLRRWHEVSLGRVEWGADPGAPPPLSKRWFPYIKGGEARRWYGNLEFVVDWEDDGARQRANIDPATGRVRSHNYNGDFAFRPGFTWSGLSNSNFTVRYVPPGHMFDAKGPMGFVESDERLLFVIALLNSSPVGRLMSMLAPTMDFKLGHVLRLPVRGDDSTVRELAQLAETAIQLARADWDSHETSYGFMQPTGLRTHSAVAAWVREVDQAVKDRTRLQADCEAKIDVVVAGAYGVEDLTPARAASSDAVESHTSSKDRCEALVSYAVGCMFGRYSLNEPGLILADQGATVQDYLKKVPSPNFMPDVDNVIPIVDGDWFEDDIVERFRQFLRAAFGDQYFEENLRFVTELLGVKNLRDYFVKSFYKDHVQRYKKRPIYWLFSSPKGSFNALIYMHRYTPSTVSTVLNEYLREFQAKLKASLENAERSNNAKEADRLRKILLELDGYEHEVLYPLASQNIAIDLDDGVKVNYPRFGAALKKIPGLEASE